MPRRIVDNPLDFVFLLGFWSIKHPAVFILSSRLLALPNKALEMENHWISEFRWILAKSSGFWGVSETGKAERALIKNHFIKNIIIIILKK